ncbi:putative transposable element encoded protein [Trachipleistophora hominis]|uniref:Putative transposable element encoded protein n=1 Tax=Trachipleistophora hominis TaxID=72359 RepID=L7K015_TRAHO|nr:putative transposable element encoded protein [Trachipleistophora hominis]
MHGLKKYRDDFNVVLAALAPIKMLLVKSVLLLIATYGCELYGMSTARLVPLQRMIDHALKNVLSCGSSYCRKATYEVLRIDCVVMQAAKLRTRAFLNWKTSRTTIGELINQPFKCPSATWITGTKRWLHSLLHCEIPATQREAVRAGKSRMAERLLRIDRSVISSLR